MGGRSQTPDGELGRGISLASAITSLGRREASITLIAQALQPQHAGRCSRGVGHSPSPSPAFPSSEKEPARWRKPKKTPPGRRKKKCWDGPHRRGEARTRALRRGPRPPPRAAPCASLARDGSCGGRCPLLVELLSRVVHVDDGFLLEDAAAVANLGQRVAEYA